MHELAITHALIRQVEGIAGERHAENVSRIVVRIGPLSGVEPALLRNAWSVSCAGTCAANAELVLEDSTVRVRCLDCGAESEVPGNRLLCASCGRWHTQLLTGDELLLVRVELQRNIPAGNRQVAASGIRRPGRVRDHV
jgi:hydrogenase nickel incorporation protein HypA/HybF